MPVKPKSKKQKGKKEILEINRELQNEIDQNWLNASEEGELSIDVYQDDDTVYVTSTIAGVKPENLEISVNNDLLTIRGFRKREREVNESDYFLQECFWGQFSRSIVLPFDVAADKISAEIEDGVLTVILPKLKRLRNIPIKIK